MIFLPAFCFLLRSFQADRRDLVLENLALRQQLAALHRSTPSPKLRNRDRAFWALLSRWWSDWRSALLIVSPATVVRWHRRGFCWYWRWKSWSRPGRPRLDPEVRRLIRRMSLENPLWGVPRIQAELRLLGCDLAESTVARYMARRRKPPSPTWRSFLTNHVDCLASVDFFVAPTATFQLLYCFLVLSHDRRKVVHFNITAHPTAAWVARQITQAFPFSEAPRYLIRDNDGVYGDDLRQHLESLGIEEVRIAPRSPWQNPYVERVIGTIRRECLDHVIVWNERHLYRVLKSYFDYYHNSRTHRALDDDSPRPREVQPPVGGKVVAVPQVGSLHHCYIRAA